MTGMFVTTARSPGCPLGVGKGGWIRLSDLAFPGGVSASARGPLLQLVRWGSPGRGNGKGVEPGSPPQSEGLWAQTSPPKRKPVGSPYGTLAKSEFRVNEGQLTSLGLGSFLS